MGRRRKEILKPSAKRECRECGKDPSPNIVYCPPCHEALCEKLDYEKSFNRLPEGRTTEVDRLKALASMKYFSPLE